MYTVSLLCNHKEYKCKFPTEAQAIQHAQMFWHLGPVVTDPKGRPVLPKIEDFSDPEL
jgi:hypothetical protein